MPTQMKSPKNAKLNDNIVLQNEKIKLVFSNRGGLLVAAYLKDYSKDLDGKIPLKLTKLFRSLLTKSIIWITFLPINWVATP